MTCRRLQALLLAALAAISIDIGATFFRPTLAMVVVSRCCEFAAGALIAIAYRLNSRCSGGKSETLQALKQRTAVFESIAGSLADEANALTTEVSALATYMLSKARDEKGSFDAAERLLNQVTVLSDVTASTEKCLTQLQTLATVAPSESPYRHRPFSNSFAGTQEIETTHRIHSHRSDSKTNQHQITATLIKQFSAINVLVQSLTRSAGELRVAQTTLVSSSENLAEGLKKRAASSERISLEAERMAAIFREVDFVVDLAIQNSPLFRATMTAGTRIENGHPDSGKRLALKTLPGGELDRSQIVEIR